MKDNDNRIAYLSDDELERLLMDTENEPLVQAPDHIDKKVLSIIGSVEAKKVLSFRLYCARVGFAVAVAVMFVCIVPFISNLRSNIPTAKYSEREERIASKVDILAARSVMTKEEVLKQMDAPGYLEETEMTIRSYIDELVE